MDNKLEKVNSSQVVSSLTGEEALIVETAVKTFTEIGKIMGDYAKCRQEQITERQRIRAQLKIITTQIQANKEKYIHAIDKYYQNKDRIYDFVEQALRASEKGGDMEMMKMIYSDFFSFISKNSPSDELKIMMDANNNFINFIE